MRPRTASVPLAVLALLALVGCGPAPTPTPTAAGSSPSPSTSGEATVAPDDVDPLETVTRMLVQTETIYFGDDEAWGVDGFRYDGPHTEAIAKLTTVFGSTPEAESSPGLEGSVSWSYSWSGFLLYFYEGGTVSNDMGVNVTAASVNGITIETLHGVHVGTPMAEAVALADTSGATAGETGDVFDASFDLISVGPSTVLSVVAFTTSSDASGTVDQISAPISTGAYTGE